MGILEDCAIAVDASYYIRQMLENFPSREPLMCALAGLTSIHMHMENELNQWKANKMTPFFIFDGQPVVGQDDVTVSSGVRAVARASEAWDLYFTGRADEAVGTFGAAGGASCSPF